MAKKRNETDESAPSAARVKTTPASGGRRAASRPPESAGVEAEAQAAAPQPQPETGSGGALELQATLCEAATVRGGLLHILGGGITRIVKDQFPAQLGLQLGILVTAPANEVNRPHRLALRVTYGDQQLSNLVLGLTLNAGDGGLVPGEQLCVPLVASLMQHELPGPGLYTIHAELDGGPGHSLKFLVLQQPGS